MIWAIPNIFCMKLALFSSKKFHILHILKQSGDLGVHINRKNKCLFPFHGRLCHGRSVTDQSHFGRWQDFCMPWVLYPSLFQNIPTKWNLNIWHVKHRAEFIQRKWHVDVSYCGFYRVTGSQLLHILLLDCLPYNLFVSCITSLW